MASLWGGRFEKDMDDIVKRYNASIFFDITYNYSIIKQRQG